MSKESVMLTHTGLGNLVEQLTKETESHSHIILRLPNEDMKMETPNYEPGRRINIAFLIQQFIGTINPDEIPNKDLVAQIKSNTSDITRIAIYTKEECLAEARVVYVSH